MSDILLEETSEGERLKLVGSGDWIATNARRLESQIDSASKRYAKVAQVDIDMGKVGRLDTFGAWLLERLVRGAAAQGLATEIDGLPAHYRDLLEEVRQSNRAPPAIAGGRNPFTDGLEFVGRKLAAAGADLAAIGQKLKACPLEDSHRSRTDGTARR